MYTSFICSKSQPYYDRVGSKHVEVWILHKLVFDGCLFFILWFNTTGCIILRLTPPVRLRWHGRAERMPEQTATATLEGTERPGRWRDQVEEDWIDGNRKNKQAMARDRLNGERLYWKPRSTADCGARVVALICSIFRSLIRCIQFLKKINKCNWKLEGCLTVHLPHEIIWTANFMQQGNFINVFLARHVSGAHRTHDLRSGSQDHHPSKNSVQKTICCNPTSNAPDDGRSTQNMYS